MKEKALRPGWIEDGIISKSFEGSLDDKDVQKKYIIPLSSTMRSIVDRGLNNDGDAGIVIIGEQGLPSEKFVLIFRNEFGREDISRHVYVFWIKEHTPFEILQLFLKNEIGEDLTEGPKEPVIDYVEYLREQVYLNRCADVFSPRLPEHWQASRTWINDSLRTRSEDAILLRENPTNASISLGLLLSNWISEINENMKIKKPIAACIFQRSGNLETFFWDGPREIVTTAIFEDYDMASLSTNLIMPLWTSSKEYIQPLSKTVSTGSVTSTSSSPVMTEVPSEYKAILSRVQNLLGSVDIDDTFRRIERIEGVIGELEHMSEKDSNQPTSTRINQMESRLRKALDRLDNLVDNLSELEERIESIYKQME